MLLEKEDKQKYFERLIELSLKDVRFPLKTIITA